VTDEIQISEGGTRVTAPEGSIKPHPRQPCVLFYSVGNPSLIGLRNNCADCRVAVVQWAGGGFPWTYRVPGYSQITISMQSDQGDLIGENPC
jgi:hypothetical protein